MKWNSETSFIFYLFFFRFTPLIDKQKIYKFINWIKMYKKYIIKSYKKVKSIKKIALLKSRLRKSQCYQLSKRSTCSISTSRRSVSAALSLRSRRRMMAPTRRTRVVIHRWMTLLKLTVCYCRQGSDWLRLWNSLPRWGSRIALRTSGSRSIMIWSNSSIGARCLNFTRFPYLLRLTSRYIKTLSNGKSPSPSNPNTSTPTNSTRNKSSPRSSSTTA